MGVLAQIAHKSHTQMQFHSTSSKSRDKGRQVPERTGQRQDRTGQDRDMTKAGRSPQSPSISDFHGPSFL